MPILTMLYNASARKKVGLNVNKTKGFSYYISKVDKIPIFIKQLVAEEVRDFKYLESTRILNG